MSTYTPIATLTVGTATGGLSTPITFSSIPQGYTDLIIVANGLVTSGASTYFRFNGDTGNNYSITSLRGNGSAASSERTTNVSVATWSVWRTTNIQYGIIQLQNYSNSTTYKSFLSRSYDDAPFVYAYVGMWRNTSPITSIQILCDTTFATGTTFSLYGIAVGNSSAKADGGNTVVTDGTYWYHTFKSSGAFIPRQALTNVDYLVVAGGGAGGAALGGGGGAGGLRSTLTQTGGNAPGTNLESKLSLSKDVAYTVAIGAGGPALAHGAYSQGIKVNGSDSIFAGIISLGGGGGGSSYQDVPSIGANGGSGGGGAGRNNTAGGSGTANQGYGGGLAGGQWGAGEVAGGGGGGAGAAGANCAQGSSVNTGGAGGVGVQITAFATATGTGADTGYYAGGGGGWGSVGTRAAGGLGGGGAGGTYPSNGNGVAGTTNTGGGGGGVYQYAAGITAGNGGSGIVIIRYAV